MKKLFLTLLLCSFVLVAGCNQKEEKGIPKSVTIYQQLNLTTEQNKQLADIRATQRTKMEAVRKDLDAQRKTLLDPEKIKNLPEDKKKENYEKYRKASDAMREKLTAARSDYDKSFMGILDDNQKKTYQKYLNQREKEKAERMKRFEKSKK